MSTLLVLPAGMVEPLRQGLHLLIAEATEDLAQVVRARGQYAEFYKQSLSRLCLSGALFDVIGWAPTEPPTEVTVDLREHGWALTRAVENALLVGVQELEDTGATCDERAKSGEPFRRETSVIQVLVLHDFVLAVEARMRSLEGVHQYARRHL